MSANAQRFNFLSNLSSYLRLGVFFLYSAVCISVIILVVLARGGAAYYRVVRGWAWGGLWIFGVRVESRGVESLERGRDYVILANHRSVLDPFAIVAALGPRQTRWVAKRELTRVPLFGVGLKVTGQILIDRSDHQQAVDALRKQLGKSGVSVVFFAEGRRATGAELLPFKKGGAAFAIDAGLPVVPLAVSGSETVLPRKSLRVRPGVIRVAVGEPVSVTALGPRDREALTEQARSAVWGLLEETVAAGSPYRGVRNRA